MRKLILLTVFIIYSLAASFGQATANEPIQKKYVYCELIYSGTYYIEIDNGVRKRWGANYISDKNGRPIRFETIVAALNYMGDDGWELVQTYVEPKSDTNIQIPSSPIFHYVLKKERVKTSIL